MKRMAFFTFFTFLLALLQFQASFASENQLIITGSSTIAPLIAEIAKRYESLHEDTRIEVQTGGSSRGMHDVRKGIAHIGMVSRGLSTKEKDLTPHLLAKDGIAIIVHQTNPIKNLSKQEILSIYTGEISNWQSLGGEDLPISVVHKAAGRSTQERFLDYLNISNRKIKAQVIVGDNQQAVKTIAANPTAIGYLSIGTAEYEEANGTPIRRITMDGQLPSTQSVQSGEFHVARELNLVTFQKTAALTDRFIAFAQSDAVHDLIVGQYFVPIDANEIQ